MGMGRGRRERSAEPGRKHQRQREQRRADGAQAAQQRYQQWRWSRGRGRGGARRGVFRRTGVGLCVWRWCELGMLACKVLKEEYCRNECICGLRETLKASGAWQAQGRLLAALRSTAVTVTAVAPGALASHPGGDLTGVVMGLIVTETRACNGSAGRRT